MNGATQNQYSADSSNSITYIAPPILNQIENATNSASITVSGSSSVPHVTIELFVNGSQVDQTGLKSNNTFSFNTVSLQQGANDIKTMAQTNDGKQSGYSNDIQITYSNNPPSLTISSPSDGQTFSKDQSPVPISGKTNTGAQVTVNGAWAIVDDKGNFTYLYPLQSGDNDLKINAVDSAGNSTQKEIHIKSK
jgi:hypothetical protein